MQQRAAVARAIVTNPAIILADEPTGNLDSTSSKEIMAIFAGLNADGRTVVLITHEEDIAAYASRVVRLRDGQIVSDVSRPGAVGANDRNPARSAHIAGGLSAEELWTRTPPVAQSEGVV